jgi:hypothetical protein
MRQTLTSYLHLCRFGNDIPGPIPYSNTLNECLKACDDTPGCIDVSYVNGTPGPCYMKQSIGAIIPNSNIWGGRKLTDCTSNTLGLHRKRVAHVKKAIHKRAVITRTTTVVSTTTAGIIEFTFAPERSGTTTRTVTLTQATTTTAFVTTGSAVATQTIVVPFCPTATRV